MTQPPFDPYGRPVPPGPPVHQVHPGQPVHPVHPGQPVHPMQPMQPVHTGHMRGVDQFTTAVVRPGAVVAAFVFWLLTALSWPLGTLVLTLVEDGGVDGFGPIMTLFATGCLAVAGVWGAVSFLGGNYHARLALCGVSMVLAVLVVAAAIVASRGSTEPLSWVVIVLRLLLPAVASVFSFLPGTRHYFAGQLG